MSAAASLRHKTRAHTNQAMHEHMRPSASRRTVHPHQSQGGEKRTICLAAPPPAYSAQGRPKSLFQTPVLPKRVTPTKSAHDTPSSLPYLPSPTKKGGMSPPPIVLWLCQSQPTPSKTLSAACLLNRERARDDPTHSSQKATVHSKRESKGAQSKYQSEICRRRCKLQYPMSRALPTLPHHSHHRHPHSRRAG